MSHAFKGRVAVPVLYQGLEARETGPELRQVVLPLLSRPSRSESIDALSEYQYQVVAAKEHLVQGLPVQAMPRARLHYGADVP
jgi:hypothetical protein